MLTAPTNAKVTFSGQGRRYYTGRRRNVSDEIPFAVEAGREFCISMYFAGLTQLVTGAFNSGRYITKYFGKGDWAEEPACRLGIRRGRPVCFPPYD